MRFYRFVQSIFSVGLNDNRQTFASCGMPVIFNGSDRSADAGMDWSADKSCLLADHLTDFYRIANLNYRIGRSACMHGQRNDHRLRIRESLKRNMLRKFFPL